MIDRAKFFDGVRHGPFPGRLTADQVRGLNAILDEWERRGLQDNRWLAYMLATAYHETAHTMQPIEEYGKGHGHKYGQYVNGHAYYGRGYVQLTWDYNYKTLGDLLSVDLLNHPERALEPAVAAGVMFEGMERGMFTGKKLGDFFNARMSDYYNARTIINGHDRATLIEGYAKQFFADLNAATKA